MKRKAGESATTWQAAKVKRPATEANGVQKLFGKGLFDPETVAKYTSQYASSEPYHHAVVPGLIDDGLLRSVRSEIIENIHFTPKETDIYKIHQSGDLANLDGLDASALEKLPSLLQLRDALYCHDFRQWLSHITGAGPLSGKETDMAVNLYVPGCHLLCHDDVIGSRRVSYILYLTDPDKPWQPEWGGALRLYPTQEFTDENGKAIKLPNPKWSVVIPPAWNQLSFFAVQPGESFHDVEEVYKSNSNSEDEDGGRLRMAISGWFHIPQEGEDGYEPGMEEKLAEKSSLQQLQGNAAEFDEPLVLLHPPVQFVEPAGKPIELTDSPLSQDDLDFLIKFISPSYLTPDTVDQLRSTFAETSTLQLANILNPKFAERLKNQILQSTAAGVDMDFKISRPPHKHRYQYIHANLKASFTREIPDNPFDAILNCLLPSLSFHIWLRLVTGLTLENVSALARRFRRGLDYQLAQSYAKGEPQLEYCLCVTPTDGWGGEVEDVAPDVQTNMEKNQNGAQTTQPRKDEDKEDDNVGGYEVYMAGEDEPDDDKDGSDDGVDVTKIAPSHTGAGNRRSTKSAKADPAIYRAAEDNDDDGILLSLPASWNTLSISLVDQGTLRFVKYVSASAPGDRYDFFGCMEVLPGSDGSGSDEESNIDTISSDKFDKDDDGSGGDDSDQVDDYGSGQSDDD